MVKNEYHIKSIYYNRYAYKTCVILPLRKTYTNIIYMSVDHFLNNVESLIKTKNTNNFNNKNNLQTKYSNYYNPVLSSADAIIIRDLFKLMEKFNKKVFNSSIIFDYKSNNIDSIKVTFSNYVKNSKLVFYFENKVDFEYFNDLFIKKFNLITFCPKNDEIKNKLEEYKDIKMIKPVVKKKLFFKNHCYYEYRILFKSFRSKEIVDFNTSIKEILNNFENEAFLESTRYSSSVYLNKKDLDNIILLLRLSNTINNKNMIVEKIILE